MECDMLIDLGESPSSTTTISEHTATGLLNSSMNAGSCNVVLITAASDNGLDAGHLRAAKGQLGEDMATPRMKFKAQSVDSLSSLKSLRMPPQLGSPMSARRPLGVNLNQSACENSSSLLSPFASPRPQSIPSLTAESLLDAESVKLLSPFGWTPTRNKRTIEEAIHVEDVPVGDLVQVQELASTLPDDMFDLDTLGRKQLEHSNAQLNVKTTPSVQVLLPSLSSIGSDDMNINGTLNKAFIETLSDESNLFPTPDDSVFEEAQGLSKVLQKMAVEDSSLTLDSIEDEDGSIVYDCPDWKDEGIENVGNRLMNLETGREMPEVHFNGNTVNEEGVSRDEIHQKSGSVCGDMFISPGSACKNVSFSSSISAISPSPLSTGSVESIKLKAGNLIGNQFNTFPLKLRASSCSSVPSSKPGPIKALMPMGQAIRNRFSTPETVTIHSRSHVTETPSLKVMNSPAEGINLARRMSSTPKPHVADDGDNCKSRVNHGSSLKRPPGNRLSKREQASNSGTKKATGAAIASSLSSSAGKLQENRKAISKDVALAKSSTTNPNPHKKIPFGSPRVEASVHPKGSSRHYPSPLLARKISDSPSVMKTPSRSVSTGSLSSASSANKMRSSPQMPSLQSHGRSNSSSKLPLCYTSRPLVETSVNSPAKHSSPLHKLVSKFRRNLGPKVMKENVHPM